MKCTSWRLRGVRIPMILCALATLTLMGSPGCGCGDDDLVSPGGEPERCCCTFSWLPPRDVDDTTAVVSLESVGASLDAVASPALLTGVSPLEAEEFEICIDADHVLGALLTLVITGQTSATEYGRITLIYQDPCEPELVQGSPGFDLTTTDCGGPPLRCCCLFEWVPGRTAQETVDLVVENEDDGLDVTISPSTLTGVEPDVMETFTVCVAADHLLLDGFDLVVRFDGSEIGRARIVYRTRCTPEIGDLPGHAPLLLTSTECGAVPQCCCTFEYDPPRGTNGDVALTVENETPGLNVQIEPDVVLAGGDEPPFFTVCVTPDDTTVPGFRLVATHVATSEVLGRLEFLYVDPCRPTFDDVPDSQPINLISEDCELDPLQCCCDIFWQAAPDFGTHNLAFSLENVESSLVPASIVPTAVDGVGSNEVVVFTVCVDRRHDTLASLDLVIRDSDTGAVLGSLPLEYDLCIPIAGDPVGSSGTFDVLCDGPD